MPVRIDGYLVQAKLEAALREIAGDGWTGSELIQRGTKRRWDMGFTHASIEYLVEFDGDEHYRHTLKIKIDREKDALAIAAGKRVVRIPYWVQLDSATFAHYFGFDAEIAQSFPHGFITTKIFPASFCEMGIERFERELAGLPEAVREDVVCSLTDRATEHGVEYVLPTRLRALVGPR